MRNNASAGNGQPFLIFVIEDDLWYGELLVHHLSMNPDYEVVRFETANAALPELHRQPAVITLDYTLPDMKGDEALRRIQIESPSTSVIVISAQENISTAIDLLKQGAYDYLVKDDETRDRLWKVVSNIRQKVDLEREIDQLKEEIGYKYDMNRALIGNCEEMQQVYRLIEKAARTTITVSVAGETGTGKELVAKAIHFNSERARQPMVAVNIASVPHDLIEAELFGHEKGAFTGAVARRIGKFEEAHHGTLFLDEIAEMDLSMQSKLLRVLQEREISRLGSNQLIPVDVRIIVATHKDLAEEMRKGRFREDLYFRLLGMPVHLPALRNRGNDILILAKHFMDEFCGQNGMVRKSLSASAREKLLAYEWPGNVRELKAVIELTAVMTDGNMIESDDIIFTASKKSSEDTYDELTLEELNLKVIRTTLQRTSGNVIETAKKLDIAKSKIYNLLKEGKI